MENMKRSPVRIDAGRRFTAVNITDEALRRRDPFEHGVWRWHWSSAMATDGEHSFLAVRVKDPQDKKAGARVFRVADAIDSAHRGSGARNQVGRDESRNSVIATADGDAVFVQCLPCPAAAYRLRRSMTCGQPGSRTS